MTFKSAYFKLTIFYVAIVMVISVGFSFALHNLAVRELGRGLKKQNQILKELPLNGPQMPPPNLEKRRDEQLAESTGRLAGQLVYFNILILVSAAVASYFLAKRTLKPIEDMVIKQNNFIADAAHELKTPLTAMRAEIEVGRRDQGFDLAAARKLSASNLEEIAKLETLANALLQMAKHQQEFKAEFHKVALADIMAEAFEKLEGLAKKKAIKFQNEFANVAVNGDRASLTELLIILIDNAIKYSPAKATVAIKIKQEANLAKVEIIDHGQGIKASDLPLIFNRFYRADHSRAKDTVAGYGLGLAIAKRIAKIHQGDISVTSTVGQGSCFTVSLPAL